MRISLLAPRAAVLAAVTIALHAAPARAQSYDVSVQCNSDDWVSNDTFSSITCDEATASGGILELSDLDGGTLDDGDVVTLMTYNVIEFTLISIDKYAGAPLDSWYDNQNSPTDEEKFIIENLDCDSCQIQDGSRVSFENVSNGKYWSAVSCGGGSVNGTATSRGTCESFEIKVW